MNLAEAIEELETLVGRLDRDIDSSTEPLLSHLAPLEGAVEAHIDDAECVDGLFEQILDEAPRLAHEIKWLADDHEAIRTNLASVRAALGDGSAWADSARQMRAFLLQLREHCHRSMALAQDAYGRDVGTGD